MSNDRPTFELARFTWGAPDRLELAGRFVGLSDLPSGTPSLVITGANGVHRLPVVSDSLSGAPDDGGQWEAVFAWQEAPVAFDVATLEFGDDVVVELPEPSSRRARARRQTLEVSRERGQEPRPADADSEPADDATPHDGAVESDGVQQLRAQAELLATEEALREARIDLQRSQEEMARARDDLASERSLREADADRFRRGLAEIRDAAERALAAEQTKVQQLGGELHEAQSMIGAKDAALEDLTGMLDAATATRAEAESQARAEIEELRKRVAALEGAGKEADQLRAELEATRGTLDDLRGDAERLLSRLSGVRGAAGDGAPASKDSA